MTHLEFDWTSRDGLQLYGQAWQPPDGCRGVACLVHGLGEHSGRYGHVAEFLNRAGYVLLTFDLRGHGRSEGQRGYTPSYTALMDDIEDLLGQAAQRYPARPRFLYGHSLGGNLVLNYALRRQPDLAGVIATSPSLKPGFTPLAWKVGLAKLFYRLWPTLSLSSGLDLSAMSRDPELLQGDRQDGLGHDRLSARLGLDLLRSGQWALAHAAEFPLPLLLMHGSADRITSAPASRAFAGRVKQDCTFKLWDGLYHELHNEPEREEVLAVVVDWLREHE